MDDRLGRCLYSLSIDEFYINTQNNAFLDIRGRGTVSATGFRDTEATWAFSLREVGDVLSVWASTTTVPEPDTPGLFGIALAAVGLLRRRPWPLVVTARAGDSRGPAWRNAGVPERRTLIKGPSRPLSRIRLPRSRCRKDIHVLYDTQPCRRYQ